MWILGTLDYIPPEFFDEGSYRAVPYSVWQLGVVMYTMLFGRFPFNMFDDIIPQEPHMNNEQLSQCKPYTRSTTPQNTSFLFYLSFKHYCLTVPGLFTFLTNLNKGKKDMIVQMDKFITLPSTSTHSHRHRHTNTHFH